LRKAMLGSWMMHICPATVYTEIEQAFTNENEKST